jgi:hypothetical protein
MRQGWFRKRHVAFWCCHIYHAHAACWWQFVCAVFRTIVVVAKKACRANSGKMSLGIAFRYAKQLCDRKLK